MVNLNAKATYNLDKIIGAKESQKLLINVQRLQEHCPVVHKGLLDKFI